MCYTLGSVVLGQLSELRLTFQRGKIELNTPDLIAEKVKHELQQKKKKTPRRPKPMKRLSVISPSIETAHHKVTSYVQFNSVQHSARICGASFVSQP